MRRGGRLVRELTRAVKGASNTEDLEIKVGRKVDFLYNAKEFTLYPFFRKDRMVSVHFLLTKGDAALSELEHTGFFDLLLIEKETAYYYLN